MTARTHDLFAFTSLTLVLIYTTVPAMTLATAITAFGANFLGALFPDLDNSTAEIWDQIRGGRILNKVLPPLLGGHRYITHSLVGLFLIGWLLRIGLGFLGKIILVDMNVVWWGFMLGMTSHLVADSLTREGVMWFFPIPWKIGFPPFKSLRIRTGGKLEKALIFPGLVGLNIYLIYTHYQQLWQIAQSWVSKPY